VADLRVFLDANILFTAAYSLDGLSAFLIELATAGRLTLLTSPLAVVEAERNLETKRPAALPAQRRSLATAQTWPRRRSSFNRSASASDSRRRSSNRRCSPI
jgi:predicted nucleic acid-binding protein